jgi:antitoxin component of MazEF toxin-antitoxin module
VDISVEHDHLLVRPLRRPRYRLADLVKKIDRKNVHGEVQTGARRGREAW